MNEPYLSIISFFLAVIIALIFLIDAILRGRNKND